jgi:DNA polymerase-3 subunit gamma/tau
MSYEVLARRYRPLTFDDVAGQRHVTITLRNALLSGRLPHAILLAGPRGIGKTSIARILARALNCDEGPTDAPCGKCSPCVEIGSSNSLDVQEIDAATHTGIDDVREIRENIRYAASPGKHRIFIIDEVHMLSTAACNALLKTLEEPPDRSLFIFATTNPQKLPATVLSRVQRFDLRRLGPAELMGLLGEIARTEKLDVPESVLRAIVREADGSARDAETLLDRLMSGLGKKISEEDAAAVLDLVDHKLLHDLLEPVLQGDPAAALRAARNALAGGVQPSRLAAEMLAELRNLLVARLVDDPTALIDAGADEVAEIRERAKPHAPETLQRLFRVLLTRTQDLAFAPRADHAFEMAVVRLATLPDGEALTALMARLENLEPGAPPRGGGGAGGAPSPTSSGGASGDGGGGGRSGARARRRAAEQEAASPSEAAPRDLSPQEEARLRKEARAHPVVQDAIEVLDAELRQIRTPSPE